MDTARREPKRRLSDDERTVHDDQVVETKKDVEDASVERVVEVHPDELEFPDGGLRAWLVVLGGAVGNASTFGYVNAWGIFQGYYETTLLHDNSPSSIAWIGSIQYAFTFLPGLVIGRLFDRGYLHLPLLIGSVMLAVCTLLVAECTVYWQFLLCQGFAVGISCGMVFGPVIAVVAHWFKKRKGLALGVMAFGSSTGATVYPVVVRKLIDAVGFQWTMRILALILLCMLSITNLTLERRLPPKKEAGPFINLKEFRSPAYSVYCASGFVAFLGMYTILTYINVSAASVGIDPNLSSYMVSISNAGSAAARIFAGYLTDKYGPLTIMIPATIITAITTYIWPFVTSKSGYIGLGLIYGMASGFYAAMLAAPCINMGETQTVGLRVGMFFSILAIGGLIGPPISGAINHATGDFKAVGYYAGTSIILATVALATARYIILRGWRGKA